jgi:hypothetical protein
MKPLRFPFLRLALAPGVALAAALAACSAVLDESGAYASRPVAGAWPPPWTDPAAPPVDELPPRFEAPHAEHCHQRPSTREVPGNTAARPAIAGRSRGDGALVLCEDRNPRRADTARGALPSAPPAARAVAMGKAEPSPAERKATDARAQRLGADAGPLDHATGR